MGWAGVLGLEAEELVDLVITVFFYLFAEFVFSLKFNIMDLSTTSIMFDCV